MDEHNFHINKELHISHQHNPHRNDLNEHYCRRWLSISQLKSLAQNAETTGQVEVGLQFSKYTETEDEYICFTVARPAYFPSTKNVSVTIGLLADTELAGKIKFLTDPAIPRKKVSVTCERCTIKDCSERASAPTVIENRTHKLKMEEALEELMK